VPSPATPTRSRSRRSKGKADRGASPTTGLLLRTGADGQPLGPVQWVDLGVSPAEMRPFFTLVTGQCFHWHQLADDLWAGVLGPYALAIRETSTSTFFASLGGVCEPGAAGERSGEETSQQIHSYLRSYFQLDENFTDLFDLV
jgi:hypothetical protein